ncbi:MAG: SUMF1/EgtB/PvdO family nonheme iron enzyme, partial [Planctomycetota bacterium]
MSFVHARRGAVLLLIPVLALTLSFPPSADVQAEEILAQAAPKAESVEFAGMKPIPAGEFKMGLDVKDLVKLYGDPKKKPSRKHHKLLMEEHKMDWWEMLLLETPEHEVETVAYALDVFTVTNAQYRRFLDESQKASFFTRKKVNTLSLVAKEIFGERDFDAWYAESIFWLNEAKLLQRWEEIRKTNEPRIEAILKEFNAFLPAAAKKKDFLELPDKQRAEGWVMFVLPDGIALTVYRRPIPDHWLKAAPDDDDEKKDPKKHVPRELLPKKMESWPVVWVTAEDADAFAEWAGKHVPTEAEYEKAARGPDAWLYPWGKTWNWMEERNRLVWRKAEPEPKGPASQYLNLPVDVTRCADSASPYGMMHMLGNVREWTSSVPVLYPDSTAKKQDWHGSDGCRVLRSTSYGDGQLSGDGEKKPYLELMHRNTARALESTPGAGIGVTARFLAVGFRCAKYPVASRDVLLLRQKAMVASGARRSAAKYDAIRAYGVEKNDYDASGGGNHTYVKSHTTVLGVVPIDRSSFAQAQELIAASKETDPAKGGPQLFAWIYWNGDLKVEIVKEKVVQPEAPADEGAPEGEAEKPDDAGETG